MTHILHIDSSPRSERSISRLLTKEFITAWKQAYPSDTVTYRDLGRHFIPPIDEAWVAAAFSRSKELSPQLEAALKISDELIDELLAANLCVFGVPMYNYSIPANFKAYIDQIVRVKRTFTIGQDGYKGLVKDKKILVVTTRGGTYSNSPLDFQEPYLKAIFELIGITDITFIHAENLSMGYEERQQSIVAVSDAIQEFVARN
jgi:FMN-dependent NADH-azoreductase